MYLYCRTKMFTSLTLNKELEINSVLRVVNRLMGNPTNLLATKVLFC